MICIYVLLQATRTNCCSAAGGRPFGRVAPIGLEVNEGGRAPSREFQGRLRLGKRVPGGEQQDQG